MNNIIFALALVLLVACGSSSKDKKKSDHKETQSAQVNETGARSDLAPMDAWALLQSRQNQKHVTGSVYFKQQDNGVLAIILVNGLKPNSTHGIHIHQNGKCEAPEFKSAGGHLNPEGFSHAGPRKNKHHLGDLGNIKANNKGIARKDVLIQGSHTANLEVLVSRSIILHAKADDLKTDPSGNSGDRLACGIIRAL